MIESYYPSHATRPLEELHLALCEAWREYNRRWQ